MRYLIGIDIGTSSVKGILMSEDGIDRKTAREEFHYDYPKKGWVEITAESYLDTCFRLIRKLAEQLPENSEIIGISEASASGNLLLLDSENKPLTPIFNWQDERVSDEAKRVLDIDFDREGYYNITGWPLGDTFPLAQLCRIKYHEPELLERAKKVCMSTEYLNFMLTGKWGVGTSAGTPFYLIDQQKGVYYKPVLDTLGIDKDKLPPVMKTGTTVGTVTKKAAELTLLAEGTPVVLGTFDHPSAARGSGVFDEGQMLLSCGTSWVGFLPVKDRKKIIKNKLLADPFLSPDGCWGAMFSLPSVSSKLEKYIIKYISDGDGMYRELEKMAAKSSPGAGGLRINPYEDDDEEKINKYQKCDIARAIMESVGYLMKEKLDALSKNNITAKSAIMAGGPTENPVWVSSIEQILGIPVKVIDGAYAGAIGAASVAGIGTGIYRNEAEAFRILNGNKVNM
ncbi:MAG: FGGY family carbohydrate kinase [Bacillota bacterium]|nr:FGGY family carbohydrate kinase [Bacillota bacterium]